MRIICENCAFEVEWVAIDNNNKKKLYFCAANRKVYYIEFLTPDEAEYALKEISGEDGTYVKESYRKIRRCYDDVCLSDFLE